MTGQDYYARGAAIKSLGARIMCVKYRIYKNRPIARSSPVDLALSPLQNGDIVPSHRHDDSGLEKGRTVKAFSRCTETHWQILIIVAPQERNIEPGLRVFSYLSRCEVRQA